MHLVLKKFHNNSCLFPFLSLSSPIYYSAIISPTTVYEDDGLLNRVGFFTRVAEYVNGEGQTVFTSAIVFDEGPNAGSEIVSSGSYGTIVDIFLESGLVFPISGGVGNFVGASGDVAQKATGDKRSLIINCL